MQIDKRALVAALILAEQVAREQGLEDITIDADDYHQEVISIHPYPDEPVQCRIKPDSYGDDWRRKGKRKGRRAR